MTPHRYRVYIRATPEQVWQGITDPGYTQRYFHGTAFTSSLEPGTGYRYTSAEGDAAEGTIEAVEPGRRLVMTWRSLYDPSLADEPPSRVEWTVTEAGDGLTRLDVAHLDLARSPRTWASVQHGWVHILDSMKSLLETGEPLPRETVAVVEVDDDPRASWHRAQGVECNNSVWEMLDAERTPANDEEMLRRAYAAAYHWQRAKGRQPINEARALYMLAKAHLAAGLDDRALHYADACLAATDAAGDGAVDFDHAYAHEMRARGLHAVGRRAEAEAEWAVAVATTITDPDDRAIVEADFAGGL